MTDILNSFLTLLPAFTVVGLGYALGKAGVIPPASSKAFGAFVFYVAMPAYLFVTIAGMPDVSAVPLGYMGAFAVAQIAVAVVAYSALLLRRHTVGEGILGAMGACYTNSAFMGIPIVILLYGSPLPIIAITVFQVTFLSSVILITQDVIKSAKQQATGHSKRNNPMAKGAHLFTTVLANPLILSPISGFFLAKSGHHLPESLRSIINFIGSPGIPLALFSLGLSLSNKIYDVHSRSREVHFLVFLKSIAHPAAAFFVGRYIFALSDLWLGPLVICAALPTAVNNYIFAEKYGVYQAETRDTVLYTVLLSLPVIAILFTALR